MYTIEAVNSHTFTHDCQALEGVKRRCKKQWNLK